MNPLGLSGALQVIWMALACLISSQFDGQLLTMPGAGCEDLLIKIYIYLCKAAMTWLNSIPYHIARNISVPKISWFGPKPSVKKFGKISIWWWHFTACYVIMNIGVHVFLLDVLK